MSTPKEPIETCAVCGRDRARCEGTRCYEPVLLPVQREEWIQEQVEKLLGHSCDNCSESDKRDHHYTVDGFKRGCRSAFAVADAEAKDCEICYDHHRKLLEAKDKTISELVAALEQANQVPPGMEAELRRVVREALQKAKTK